MKEEEYSGISIKQDSQKSSFNPIDIMRIEKRLHDTIQTVASSIDSDDALWSENEYYEIAYAFYNETVKDLNSLKSLAGADNSHYRKASFSVASVVAKFAQKLGAQHQNYNDLLVLIKTIDPEYKVADTVIEKSADYGENSKSKTSETITANGIKSIQKIKSENGIYKPADREELDILLDSLVSIKNIDISNVKDLSYLFSVSPCPSGIYKNHNLENENELKCWDVSHVENMSYMFCNRSDFTGYAVKNWNVKNVTNAEGIFDGCKSLNSIFLEKMAFSYDVKKASRFGNVNNYESPIDNFNESKKESFANAKAQTHTDECKEQESGDITNNESQKKKSKSCWFYLGPCIASCIMVKALISFYHSNFQSSISDEKQNEQVVSEYKSDTHNVLKKGVGSVMSGEYRSALKYDIGPVDQRDVKKANDIYKRLCDNGMAKACTNLGINYELGDGLTINEDMSYILAKKACDLGDKVSCSLIYNDLIMKSSKNNQKNEKAFKELDKLCSQNETVACLFLGTHMHSNSSDKNNFKKASNLFLMSCDKGSSLGCLGYALINLENRTYSNLNKTDAISYIEKSCSTDTVFFKTENEYNILKADVSASKGLGCMTLGDMYYSGELFDGYKVGKNIEKSLLYYDRACTQGNPSSCFNYALLIDENKSLKDKNKKAMKNNYISKGKKILEEYIGYNNSDAMLYMGWVYTNGYGVSVDLKKANNLFEKSCNLNNGEACFELASNYKEGKGVSKNIKNYKNLMKKSCSLDYEDACKFAK